MKPFVLKLRFCSGEGSGGGQRKQAGRAQKEPDQTTLMIRNAVLLGLAQSARSQHYGAQNIEGEQNGERIRLRLCFAPVRRSPFFRSLPRACAPRLLRAL